MVNIKFRFSLFAIRLSIIIGVAILCDSNLLYSQENENDDEQEQAWNVSSGGHFYSRYTQYGVDLSENRSAVSIESEIMHQSGLSAGVEAFAITGTGGGYEHSSIHSGYEYPLASFFKLHGLYSYHAYKSDSANVLAGISNELTLGGTFTLNAFLFSTSVTTFFGTTNANYLALGTSGHFMIGQWSVDPSIQCCFASQTVDDILLPKNQGNGNGKSKKPVPMTTVNSTTTISGMSNLTASMAFRYEMGKGFTASLTPSYVYSPTDLSAVSSQFIITLGIEHSVDF
jgi:hypothetical protein